MWQYWNPVEITFGAGSFEGLPKLITDRPYALVTYGEPTFAELAERLLDRADDPVLTIDDVAPNPDKRALSEQCRRFERPPVPPEVIVALGGGSVIDSAKVFAAANGRFTAVLHYLQTGRGCEELSATPIIAVPTTAGTGSEVTSWATVWDTELRRKYSLSRPNLYPEHALVDPSLMLGKPRQRSRQDRGRECDAVGA